VDTAFRSSRKSLREAIGRRFFLFLRIEIIIVLVVVLLLPLLLLLLLLTSMNLINADSYLFFDCKMKKM